MGKVELFKVVVEVVIKFYGKGKIEIILFLDYLKLCY